MSNVGYDLRVRPFIWHTIVVVQAYSSWIWAIPPPPHQHSSVIHSVPPQWRFLACGHFRKQEVVIIFGDMIALYNCTHSIVAHGLDRLGMDCHTALKMGFKIRSFWWKLYDTLRDFAGCMGLCGSMLDCLGLSGTFGDQIWCSVFCRMCGAFQDIYLENRNDILLQCYRDTSAFCEGIKWIGGCSTHIAIERGHFSIITFTIT